MKVDKIIAFVTRHRELRNLVSVIEKSLSISSYFLSVLLVLGALFDYGFELTEFESYVLKKMYDFVWLFFVVTFTYKIAFQRSLLDKRTMPLTIALGVVLYLSVIPHLFHTSEPNGLWHWVWQFLGNKYFELSILLVFSFINISRGVVGFIGKKTNPALLLSILFVIVILIGAVLLLLPRSTHTSISVIDSLFISTSAVCVTGLTPIEVSTTFTIEGLTVIALLIQIGGVGVMTLTSFFAMFFMGSTGLYNQFAIRDMVGSETLGSLISTLLYILGFTFVIELIGMLFIWVSIHSTMGMTLHEEMFFSAFHAISAFCNAGFSTMSGNLGNPAVLHGHNFFFWVISFLIILGGIGFPILVNFKDVIFYYLKHLRLRLSGREQRAPQMKHLTNLNTKIVLATTSVLLVVGTVLIAAFEWYGAFGDMTIPEKMTQSFFNAVSPRTAGFSSVDLSSFSIQAIIVYMALMWIGGAAQSTAGGVKVSTFAVSVANLLAVVRGGERVDMYGRELSQDSVRRASATIVGSILLILISVFLLITIEPNIAPLNLLFEVISALGTVGSSLNTTPLLGEWSKIVVIILMFVGRIGLIMILMSFVSQKSNSKYKFPKDRVIIN